MSVAKKTRIVLDFLRQLVPALPVADLRAQPPAARLRLRLDPLLERVEALPTSRSSVGSS